MRWVNFLRGAYARKFAARFEGFRVDEAALRAYGAIAGVPDSIVQTAVTAASAEEAEQLQRVRSLFAMCAACLHTCATVCVCRCYRPFVLCSRLRVAVVDCLRRLWMQVLSTQREGHTPVRAGTSEERAAADADASALGAGERAAGSGDAAGGGAIRGGGGGAVAASAGAAAEGDDAGGAVVVGAIGEFGASAAPGDGDGAEPGPLATGYATGIDDFDVAIDTGGPVVDIDEQQRRAAVATMAEALQRGGVLVSTQAGDRTLLSDYDPDFAPLTHPSVFPYGEGGRPSRGMSEEAYFKLVLERRAATGRGDNIGMLLAFYDIHARHAVNSSTCARARATPEVFADLDRITQEDLCKLYEALRAGATTALCALCACSACAAVA